MVLAFAFLASVAVSSVACKPSKKPVDLCTRYTSCTACIEGQQVEGKTLGEAQTECDLAVAGCWVTWTKPVVCGDKVYDVRPE